MLELKQLQDKIRGSLLGGAIGDALGYPVEFMTFDQIVQTYGNPDTRSGIIDYHLNSNSKALISDDTQMSLFTANGLLFGITRWAMYGGLADLDGYVSYAYQEWYETQVGIRDRDKFHLCWIRDIPALNAKRAPGITCMEALYHLSNGMKVRNNSKGCGGVMRVAPIGLMAAARYDKLMPSHWSGERVARLSATCAAITHKHPLGYISAAFHALLIYNLLLCEEGITSEKFENLCEKTFRELNEYFTQREDQSAIIELWSMSRRALSMANQIREPASQVIPTIGAGWVGEEAVAIALYCVKRNISGYTGEFKQAIIDAVNHDGDSDSTGSLCGNIMGAIVGYNYIQDEYKYHLELLPVILELADDMYNGCQIEAYESTEYWTTMQHAWYDKYVNIHIPDAYKRQ